MARTRIVGLTGGIGSGKSTVARLLAEHGAVVVDADAIAREVVEPGTPGLDAIRERFGERVIGADGRLDRAALARIVFADPAARKDLEAITHPRIARVAAERMQAAREAGAEVVVYEAALIVENDLQQGMDALVVVSASPETQVRRVVERDGIGEDEARSRLAAQLPLEKKVAVADYVVDNEGTLGDTREQVDRIWKALIHGDDEEDGDG